MQRRPPSPIAGEPPAGGADTTPHETRSDAAPRSPVLTSRHERDKDKDVDHNGTGFASTHMSFLGVRGHERPSSLPLTSASSLPTSSNGGLGGHHPNGSSCYSTRPTNLSTTLARSPFANTGGVGKAKRTVLIDGFEYSDDDDEANNMGNGCGEGVSRNSSEDDEPEEEIIIAGAAALSDGGGGGFPTCAAATATAAKRDAVSTTLRRRRATTTAFSSAVMKAIARQHRDEAVDAGTGSTFAVAAAATRTATAATATTTTTTTDPPSSLSPSLHHQRSGSCDAMAKADGDDDASTVLSGLQMMMQHHDDCRGGGVGRKSFLNQFAPLYEIAILEIIAECDWRVANASAEDCSEQLEKLRGRNNIALSVSAHSFDSPVSLQSGAFPCFSKSSSCIAGSHAMLPGMGCNSANGIGPKLDNPTTHYHRRTESLSFSVSYASSPTGARSLHHGLHPHQHQQQQQQLYPEPAAPATSFSHGGRRMECLPPGESVQRLLSALDHQMQYQESAPLVFMAALAYLSRFAAKCVSSYDSITWANWFRMTLISLLTASKMYNEYGSRKLNKMFADIAGIPLPEVNKLELDFLYLVDFELLLEESDVEGWVQWMEALAVRHNMFTPLQTFMMGSAGADLGRDNENSFASSTAAATQTGLPPHQQQPHQDADSEDGWPPLAVRSFLSCAPSQPHHSDLQSPTNNNTGSLVGCYAAAAATPSSPPRLRAADGAGSALPARSLLPLTAATAASSRPRKGNAVDEAGEDGGAPKREEERRLFSVVHAPVEPRTPPTIRELSRLGDTPSSLLAPPMMPPASPVGFFKRSSNVGAGGSSLVGRSHGCASSNSGWNASANSVPTQRRERGDLASLHSTVTAASASSDRKPTSEAARQGAAVSTAAVVVTGTGTAPTASTSKSGGASWRGGGLNVVQRAREALNVAASLVRGHLNVMMEKQVEPPRTGTSAVTTASSGATATGMTPATPLEQTIPSTVDGKHSGGSNSATRQQQQQQSRPTSGVSAFSPSVVVAADQGQASFYPVARHPEDAEQGNMGALFSNEDEWREEEEGYWDDYGYYHYYDDEEGYYDEEGNYYTYAEDERLAAEERECEHARHVQGLDLRQEEYETITPGASSRPLSAVAPSAMQHHYSEGLEGEYAEDEDAYDESEEDDDDDSPSRYRAPPRTHSPPTV